MIRHTTKPPKRPDKLIAWILEEQRRINRRLDYFANLRSRLFKLEQAIWWLEKLGQPFGPIKSPITGEERDYHDLD